MQQGMPQKLLMTLPLAIAAIVGLGAPWLANQPVSDPPAVGAGAGSSARSSDYDETLARACEASHRAAPAPAVRGEPEGRSQSPAWLQQHRAEVERCVRDGLRVMRTARAGG